MRIVVECGCGLAFTLRQFRTLNQERGPRFQWFRDGERPEGYEYRECVCGSTHAIPVRHEGRAIIFDPESA